MRHDDGWWPPSGDGASEGVRGKVTQAGHWICWDCPREWKAPPYLPFILRTHITTHLRRFSDHLIVWWCREHAQAEYAWHPHWRLQGWYWVHDGPLEGSCLTMCDFRYVTVTYPDGRTTKLIAAVLEDGEAGCGVCGFSYSTFKTRKLLPHDDLEHLELYQGAKVKRGRRLSAAEIERRRLVTVYQDVPVPARLEV